MTAILLFLLAALALAGGLGLWAADSRRPRRTWAAAHGYSHAREDEYLTDEWTRGAAADGARARDVVSGLHRDEAGTEHEFHLLDLGRTPVLAVRRGAASEVVVDFRRGAVGAASEDTVDLGEVCGFELHASDHGAAERFVDDRVRAALSALPSAVTAVWCETSWTLAELARDSTPDDAEAALGPLCALADAARVLPPRGVGVPLETTELDPTRTLPPEHPRSADEAPEPEDPAPPVVRPEEPLQMPSRSTARAHGVVEPRALGGDDVEPIAAGDDRPGDDRQGTRVVRRDGSEPSIFADLSAELGHDPLGADEPER